MRVVKKENVDKIIKNVNNFMKSVYKAMEDTEAIKTEMRLNIERAEKCLRLQDYSGASRTLKEMKELL